VLVPFPHDIAGFGLDVWAGVVLVTFAIRDYSEGTDGGFAYARSPSYWNTSTAPGKRMAVENDYATKAEAAATQLRLLERLDKLETTLVKEFRKWARSFESRVRVNELTVAGLHERMALIEERVGELETPSSR